MELKLIPLAELDKAILAIKRAGKKLDADIQRAGLSAIHAVAEHGNIHYVNALYLALPKGTRKVAMTEWLLKFGGVKATEGKGKDLKPFSFDKDKHVDLESAVANPWYDQKPDADPDKVVDVYGLIKALLKKAQKEGVQVKNGHLLEPIRALVEEHDPDADTEGEGAEPASATDALAGVSA